MPVLVKITNRGLPIEMYDHVAAALIPQLKRQAGFHAHVCYPTADGFTVNELWDSAEQQTTWFERNVRPQLPPDAHPDIEVVELHSLATPQSA
ncbi:MAG: hypothetical protein ABR591_07360 [Candidatus Velthaea sp.]